MLLLKTMLNRVNPVKGFVYERDAWVQDPTAPNGVRIEAYLRPRQGSAGVCSCCGRRGATYDTQEERRFDFVPLWGIAVVLVYAMLRRRKRLSGKQRLKLRQILQWDLTTVRAYLLEEGLQAMWEYRSPTHAGRFLDAWCRQAMRSRIEPIKKVARSLREHRESILNWFRAKKLYNSGIVEGLNGLVKLRFRKAFGFRTFGAIEVALYHELGRLPEPKIAHRFC